MHPHKTPLLIDTFLFVIFIVLGTSCSHPRYDRDLSIIDSLVITNPQQSSRLLDVLKKDSHQLSYPQLMHYELLRGRVNNSLCIPFTTDSTMKKVVDYYESNGTRKEQMSAYYVMGCVYRDLNDAQSALLYFQNAITKGETARSANDNFLLSRVYGQIGDLFEKQLSLDNAIDAYRSAAKCAIMAKDTMMVADCYDHVRTSYFFKNSYDSVLMIGNRARKIYRQAAMYQQEAATYDMDIYIYLQEHDYLKAKKYMDVYDANSGIIDAKGYARKGSEIYYYSKGLYYLGIGKTDSSSLYFYRELHAATDYNNRQAAAKGLYLLYKKIGNGDSISKYGEQWNAMIDSSYVNMATRQLQQMHSLYDYSRFQKIAKAKEWEVQRLTIIIILGALILVIAFCIFYIVNVDKKRRMIALNHDYMLNLMNLRNKEMELTQLKQHESDSLKRIDKLSRDINCLQQELSSKQDDQLRPDQWGIDENLLNADIVIRLHELASKGTVATDNDWHRLLNHFNQYNPSFLSWIKSKELKERENNICMLIKLRFIPSELCCLLDLSSQMVTNIRLRLLYKIFKIKGGAKDFDERIRLSAIYDTQN